MNWIIHQILFIFLIGLSLKTNGNLQQFCELENRTITFDICKKRPRLTLPVCVGFCSSTTQWSFRSNTFLSRTRACQVTRHRTEYFVCPDSSHTAIELIIPLACSCTQSNCHRYHS